MKPDIRYTKSGLLNIAYQVFGSGKVDLVYIPGWVSNIDWMWACPELVHFFEELGKVARVILFDKRGTGLSDRVVEISTLEERMDDIRAVMDASGSSKAILFGHSEGGSVSALFAATYPNRTISLIAYGIFAKRVFSPDYPWAPTPEERQVVYDMIETSWGSGEMNLESLAPSKADDKVFMDWLANYFRSGASPSAAMVLTKMNTQVDIVDILPAINVPTLILQRTNDIDVKIEEGRFIAERIPNARFVEFDGNDHLFWVGNRTEVLEEMKDFIKNAVVPAKYDKQLCSIVLGQILGPTVPDQKQQISIRQYVNQFRGQIIRFDNQVFTAVFGGPSKALNCSMDLLTEFQALNVQMSIGIHIQEVSISEEFDVTGEPWAHEVINHKVPNQIILTQTVRHLLGGAGISNLPFKSFYDPHSQSTISLYYTNKSLGPSQKPTQRIQDPNPIKGPLLEKVLQIIDANLSSETFGVVKLGKELGLSERQLQRKIKGISNKSPNQLISSVRLHRAKELLLTKEKNIGEVAFLTGFSNPSYFSKAFKREFGVSPSVLVRKGGINYSISMDAQ